MVIGLLLFKFALVGTVCDSTFLALRGLVTDRADQESVGIDQAILLELRRHRQVFSALLVKARSQKLELLRAGWTTPRVELYDFGVETDIEAADALKDFLKVFGMRRDARRIWGAVEGELRSHFERHHWPPSEIDQFLDPISQFISVRGRERGSQRFYLVPGTEAFAEGGLYLMNALISRLEATSKN